MAALSLVLGSGGCADETRPSEEVVPNVLVTTTTGAPTSATSSTTPSATAAPRTSNLCTADARRGPKGQLYGRDPNQGCKFVDERGQVLPGQ
jgi:hypothetical protein